MWLMLHSSSYPLTLTTGVQGSSNPGDPHFLQVLPCEMFRTLSLRKLRVKKNK